MLKKRFLILTSLAILASNLAITSPPRKNPPQEIVSQGKQFKISKTYQINDVQKKVNEALKAGFTKKDIVVIFDIDETLLKFYVENNGARKYMAGRDLYWCIFTSLINKNVPPSVLDIIKKQDLMGDNNTKRARLDVVLNTPFINHARQKTHATLTGMQKNCLKAETVENNTAKLVKQLQNKGIKVMALTSRGVPMRDSTERQLNSVGINLKRNFLTNKEYTFDEIHGFHNGVLALTPSTEKSIDKGRLLNQFFEEIKYTPKKVIFADDFLMFIESVKNSLQEKHPNIHFEGLWYCKVDGMEFDKELANKLLCKHFGENWWETKDFKTQESIVKADYVSNIKNA